MILSLWKLTAISATLLPMCLSNFRAIVQSKPESVGKTFSMSVIIFRNVTMPSRSRVFHFTFLEYKKITPTVYPSCICLLIYFYFSQAPTILIPFQFSMNKWVDIAENIVINDHEVRFVFGYHITSHFLPWLLPRCISVTYNNIFVYVLLCCRQLANRIW